MKNILLLISIILFTSCEDNDFQMDSEFSPYVDIFINEASTRGVDWNPENKDLIISFQKDLYLGSAKVTGYATRFKDRVEVVIDVDNWNNHPQRREVLILHELGHGMLKYEHGVNTIMRTQRDKYDSYKTNRTEMLNQFFNASL